LWAVLRAGVRVTLSYSFHIVLNPHCGHGPGGPSARSEKLLGVMGFGASADVSGALSRDSIQFGISVLYLGHFMAWDLVSLTEHEGKLRQESCYLWGRLATQARPATADRRALAYQLRFRLCGERKIT